jgi:hypothetical protein
LPAEFTDRRPFQVTADDCDPLRGEFRADFRQFLAQQGRRIIELSRRFDEPKAKLNFRAAWGGVSDPR